MIKKITKENIEFLMDSKVLKFTLLSGEQMTLEETESLIMFCCDRFETVSVSKDNGITSSIYIDNDEFYMFKIQNTSHQWFKIELLENRERCIYDDLKDTALKYLKQLKVHPNVIREFDEEDKLNTSETGGMLFWTNETDLRYIEDHLNGDFKNPQLVFHVCKQMMETGYADRQEFITYLLVTPEDIEHDTLPKFDDPQYGVKVFAHTHMVGLDEKFSEYTGVKMVNGGLKRTY